MAARKAKTEAVFRTGYFDRALQHLDLVLNTAEQRLANVKFDTIVGTGFSGGVVIPALALRLGVNFALVRKESDDSHHGAGLLVGVIGKRWIFVDDFTSSGATRTRVISKVTLGAELEDLKTLHVGDYYYQSWSMEHDDYGLLVGG